MPLPNGCQSIVKLFTTGARRRAVIGLILLFVLAACADDGDQRQFAGDERTSIPTIEATVVPTFSTTQNSPVAFASPLSDQALLAVRGESKYVAGVVDGDVYLYDLESGESQFILDDDQWRAWAVTIDSTGRLIAILVSPRHSHAAWSVLFFDVDGSQVSASSIVGSGSSPSVEPDVVAAGTGGIDWAPDSTKVAVALPTGGLYLVPIEGKVKTMSPPARVPIPESISWSDSGKAITYTARPAVSYGGGVYVAPIAALPIDPAVSIPPDPSHNRSAVDAQWYGNGGQILTLIDSNEFGTQIGSLFRVALDDSSPVLVWGPGSQPDSAGIAKFGLSPDSEIIAMVTTGRSGTSSLVLLQPGGSELTIPLGVRFANPDLSWSDEGVVVSGEIEAVGDEVVVETVGLIVVDSYGATETHILFSPSLATPSASPVAVSSPVEVASPRASPAGTPPTIPSPSVER